MSELHVHAMPCVLVIVGSALSWSAIHSRRLALESLSQRTQEETVFPLQRYSCKNF